MQEFSTGVSAACRCHRPLESSGHCMIRPTPSACSIFVPHLGPTAPGTIMSRPVVLKYAETSKTKTQRTLHGTLHVYRMQEKEATAGRHEEVGSKAQKKQRKLSAKTLFCFSPICLRIYLLIMGNMPCAWRNSPRTLSLSLGNRRVQRRSHNPVGASPTEANRLEAS